MKDKFVLTIIFKEEAIKYSLSEKQFNNILRMIVKQSREKNNLKKEERHRQKRRPQKNKKKRPR